MRHEFCQSARLDSQLNIVLSGFLVVYSFLAKSLGDLNDLVQFTWLPFIQFKCFLFFRRIQPGTVSRKLEAGNSKRSRRREEAAAAAAEKMKLFEMDSTSFLKFLLMLMLTVRLTFGFNQF